MSSYLKHNPQDPECFIHVNISFKIPMHTLRPNSVYSTLLKHLYCSLLPTGTPELSPPDRKELETKLKEREEFLLPIYHQVAVQFADLHDTPGRMQEKGVITVSTSLTPSSVHVLLLYEYAVSLGQTQSHSAFLVQSFTYEHTHKWPDGCLTECQSDYNHRMDCKDKLPALVCMLLSRTSVAYLYPSQHQTAIFITKSTSHIVL